MVKIKTFVIMDLETTGLPHLEYNRTKITEMCLLAVSRQNLEGTAFGELPPMCKLSFMLNPEKSITPDSARITGITDVMVKNSPIFKQKFNTLNAFIQDLTSPVSLVAHNGYTFDYRILLAECNDAKVALPDDLLCIDSLAAFRKIPTHTTKLEKSTDSVDKNTSMNSDRSMNSTLLSDIMTDDEDEWPELNVTKQDLNDIDELCSSFSTLSPSQKQNHCEAKKQEGKKLVSYKLTDIYKRYFGNLDGRTAHRAEDDCLMLLQCMVAAQKDFLTFSDKNCKLLTDCKPFQRKGT